MTDFEKVCSFENLYTAHRMARRCKRHKRDVIKFELNLGTNLWLLKYQLDNDLYSIDDYNKFYIYEPKKREIQSINYRHRIVQHSLCDNVLTAFFEKRLIYDNYACRKDKGTHFGLKRISGFMRDYYKKNGTQGYILKADIHHYFASIDHTVLLSRLRKIIPDKDVMKLIELIVNSYNKDVAVGLPMGNQTSQQFAIYYLDTLDRLVKEKLKIKYYGRYMDDLVLIHHDKDYLKYCLSVMTEFVENELKLKFNNKTQIFPIKNGINFLGFHMYLTETGKVVKRLRRSSKSRFKKKLKRMRKDYAEGKIGINDVLPILASYKGHMQHGNTYSLREKLYSNFMLVRNEGLGDSVNRAKELAPVTLPE